LKIELLAEYHYIKMKIDASSLNMLCLFYKMKNKHSNVYGM